ncbi:MAG: hypothetical protein ACE5J9_10665, partial [Methanosarcinales archaeon]
KDTEYGELGYQVYQQVKGLDKIGDPEKLESRLNGSAPILKLFINRLSVDQLEKDHYFDIIKKMLEASCLDKVKRVHEILNYILPQVGVPPSIDWKELLQSLLEFKKEVANAGLPAEVQNRVKVYLEDAIKEPKKDNPNKSRIIGKLQEVTEVFREAGKTITEGTTLGGKLIRIAKTLGIAISSLL